MNLPADPPNPAPPEPAAAAPATPWAVPVAVAPAAAPSRGLALGVGIALAVAVVVAVVAATLAVSTQRRLQLLEQELVRRQQASQDAAAEARTLAKAAEDVTRSAAARLALIEARVAESALQRSQLEELIQALSRSRDENVLADTEAALRVALQQSAITGSPEPMVAALRQADERLARVAQPRLERVRRAVARDLDRARAASVADVATLTLKLDEATRLVDELPLANSAGAAAPAARPAPARATAPKAGAPAPAAPASAVPPTGAPGWGDAALAQARSLGATVWSEVRSLVRVTRIDAPEAMLIAPEQAFFLRENLKLRLLNARLALLSRQFDVAQSDLRQAEAALAMYFDRDSRRVMAAADMVRQVGAQSRSVVLPRPDETLAALATAAAGR